jgi:hypothetical protein
MVSPTLSLSAEIVFATLHSMNNIDTVVDVDVDDDTDDATTFSTTTLTVTTLRISILSITR